jgi:Uma2 family endonuclease
MSIQTLSPAKPAVEYPESDGQLMAENTRQFRWIVTLQGGLDALFRDEQGVFVAGDLFWYPVEGDPATRTAPDAMVVFGRPKGDRGAYRQWEEEGIAPQVVFEVLSPATRFAEQARKYTFYERFGVEEYYVYDPDHGRLTGWLREGDSLEEIPNCDGWVSPRLGMRFDLSGEELRVLGPDGRPLATYLELAEQAEAERGRAEAERARADQASQLAARLAAQLETLGIEPALESPCVKSEPRQV